MSFTHAFKNSFLITKKNLLTPIKYIDQLRKVIIVIGHCLLLFKKKKNGHADINTLVLKKYSYTAKFICIYKKKKPHE